MAYHPSEEFKKIADEVKSSGEPHQLTVRRLLRLFYQERRRGSVVSWIRHNLQKYGLESAPDFENVYIDSRIELRKKAAITKTSKGEDEDDVRDPVPRIALLPAANKVPTSVKRDATLSRAITLMMLHDFSQLPVMQSERKVDGMISLRSIVSAQTVGDNCENVRDCMNKEVQVLAQDTPLFEAVRTVMRHEVVLVKGGDETIVGLVTIADIGEQFISLAEPFWILEQIENHIRTLLDGKFSLDQLKAAANEGDTEREILSVSDLNFGEYIRILENPAHWETVAVEMDRATFVQRLDDVRNIRNDVMHFHPDGISSEDLEVLRETNKFFYTFSRFRKAGTNKKPKSQSK
jgi:CBS domain-containing protein